jgi:hypothetical protein
MSPKNIVRRLISSLQTIVILHDFRVSTYIYRYLVLVESKKTSNYFFLVIDSIEFNTMSVTRALHLFNEINLDHHETKTQIPNFLLLNSLWPKLDKNTKSQKINQSTLMSIDENEHTVCNARIVRSGKKQHLHFHIIFMIYFPFYDK